MIPFQFAVIQLYGAVAQRLGENRIFAADTTEASRVKIMIILEVTVTFTVTITVTVIMRSHAGLIIRH